MRPRPRRAGAAPAAARARSRRNGAAGDGATLAGALLSGLPRRRQRARARKLLDQNRPSGEILTPEAWLSQPSRTKGPLVRRFLAGGRISYGIPSGTPSSASYSRRRPLFAAAAYEVFPPASFWRRRAHLVRHPVGNPPSGVVFSPEATLRAGNPRQSPLRRHFGAGGPFAAYERALMLALVGARLF